MIKIEVTGNSTAEVADKLLALGTSLLGAPVNTLTGSAKMDPIMPEVAEMAAAPEQGTGAAPVGEPAPSTTAGTPTAALAAEAAGTPSAPAEPVAKTENTPAAPSEPAISADALKDLVLSVVRTKGRDAMVAVLDTFGAARASDVPQEQVQELVAALEALL